MKGFTLAEVLITLGIVGIVSAMTIPALVNNSQNRELETRLKKSYSVLQQGLNLMSANEGQEVNWINYPKTPFQAAFKKYFPNSLDCNFTNCIPYTSETNDEGETLTYIIKNYRTYNNYEIVQTTYFDDGQFRIQDGSFVLIENPAETANETSHMFLTVDINGINKKPNKWGHDLFTFQVLKNGKLVPMGSDETEFKENQYCLANSTHRMNGIGCTYKALTDKNYWKNLPK